MRFRNCLVALVAGSMMVGLQSVRAAEPADPTPVFKHVDPDFSLTPKYLISASPQTRRPIMMILDQLGLAAPLDRAGIDIHGHIEGSYTLNFDSPRGRQNPFRLFDFEHNKVLLNQLDLTVDRLVNYRNARKWDVGFTVEFMYGADAGFIHSNGLFDYFDSPRSPENQPDLTQAYLDIVVPIGTGLRLRVGKFVNLVGYEAIDPTVPINPGSSAEIDFYSRSFIFGIGYPFTHTGVLATYDVAKNVTVTAGITRGDEQSVRDNNGSAAFLGSVNWVINKQMALYVSNSTGPEQFKDSSHYRSTFDATFYYTPDNHWSFAGNGYFLYDAAGAANGGAGHLYALAALAGYKINDYLTLKGRGEWYHDPEGVRAPQNTNLYEVTLGASVYPFPHDRWGQNLKIRPEIRYDWSDHRLFNNKQHQFTFEVDVVVRL